MPETVTVELQLGGAWVDITQYVYTRDAFTITRGRADEAGQVDPSTCTFTVNNADGRFSPRNPLGVYYGQIGRNTPVRVSVTRAGTRYYRFYGEVPAWPVQWDTSGNDVYVAVQAAGILRRLSQGNSPIKSAVYRDATRGVDFSPTVKAYWPCEEAEGAAVFGSALPGGSPMKIAGSPQLSSFTGWFASDALPTFNGATVSGAVPQYTNTDRVLLRFFLHINEMPSSKASIVKMRTTGSACSWEAFLYPDGNLGIRIEDSDGNALHDSGEVAFGLTTSDDLYMMFISGGPDGTKLNWGLGILPMSNSADADFVGSLQTYGVELNSQKIGRATSVSFNSDKRLGEVAFGQITISDDDGAYANGNTIRAMSAWNDDAPVERFIRLCDEEGVARVYKIDPTFSYLTDVVTLGSQRSATLLDLVRQIADSDLGMVFEPRDSFALGYRDRLTLYNQVPALTLDYAAEELTGDLNPVDDDQDVANDITVTRIDGASANAEQTTGSLSTQAPPNGVGRYDTEVSLSLGFDDQLPDQAGWRLHLGTVDEARYPVVSVQLSSAAFDADPSLAADALTLDIGDRLVIANPPPWLPPGDISLTVQGYSETFDQFTHSISWNCTPESPWRIGVVGDPVLAQVDTDGSALASTVAATDTTINVAVSNGPLWSTNAADVPFDIEVGGEVMSVTAISGTASPQTFAVTRSVNGISKAHGAGTAVGLAQQTTISL